MSIVYVYVYNYILLYKIENLLLLDLSLQNINLPDDLFTCRDVHCLLHRPVIERLHDDIIAALPPQCC